MEEGWGRDGKGVGDGDGKRRRRGNKIKKKIPSNAGYYNKYNMESKEVLSHQLNYVVNIPRYMLKYVALPRFCA